MSSSINFVDTSYNIREELKNSENADLKHTETDPLQEIDNDVRQKFNRIDCVVFTEPIKNNLNGSTSLKDDVHKPGLEEDELIVIDNVLIQKRTGKKYKKYHINIEDQTNLYCPQSDCHRKFSTTKLLKAHVRKVHCSEKNSYVCEVCGSTFAHRYLLVRHAAVHSGRTVQCNVCAMVLSERTSLSAHLRTHSGIKPHTCAVCNKQFLRKSTLDTHLKFVHRDDLLQCPKCPDRFPTRSQWTRHTSTHHRIDQRGGVPS